MSTLDKIENRMARNIDRKSHGFKKGTPHVLIDFGTVDQTVLQVLKVEKKSFTIQYERIGPTVIKRKK